MEQPEELSHYIIVGDNSHNSKFPANKQNSSIVVYFKLLWHVSLPNLTDTSPSSTFIPIIIYMSLVYLMQAIDLHRLIASGGVNENKVYEVIRGGAHKNIKSKNLRPGDIFPMKTLESIPADCLLLSTNQMNIFIDTAMLDGETDVKDRFPISLPQGISAIDISQRICHVHCTDPKRGGRDINGTMLIGAGSSPEAKATIGNELRRKSAFFEEDEFIDEDGDYQRKQFQINEDQTISVTFDTNSFVERGSILRTAGTHYFMVLYTGVDCRSAGIHSMFSDKLSSIDVYLEKIAIINFIIQFLLGVINGSVGYYKYNSHNTKYIRQLDTQGFWTWLVLVTRNYLMLSFNIPVTLKIVIPVFRLIYGIYISWDKNFYDKNKNVGAQSLSTNVTENLGLLDVIVADKTGTLTKNKLRFIAASIADHRYGESQTALTLFDEPDIRDVLANATDHDFIMFWKCLSICHSVKINEDQELYGSNQDELAILQGLQKLDFVFHYQEGGRVTIEAPFGTYHFQILKVLPFSRQRLKMSIVVQDENGIYVFTKGAPEKVMKKCTTFSGEEAGRYESFQEKGYRTLSFSYRNLETFNPEAPIIDLESLHRLLGTIAIEDELQDDVQLSIEVLQQAGLRIWICTGDACRNTMVTATMLGLLSTKDFIVHLNAEMLYQHSHEFGPNAMKAEENSFSVLIECENDEYVKNALEMPQFVEGLERARTVIFYRCKPVTKACVASALRLGSRKVLAVGDGANDTQLLRAADVGVGVVSEDGSSNFESCDFAVPSFRHICRLILIHGHHSLHRSVMAVHYSFYKALLFAGCQAIYQFWTDFSGNHFFGPFSLVTYNNLWTLIPMFAIIFDKDISDNFLFQLSFLYKKVSNKLTLTGGNLTWYFVAIYQSSVCMAIAYLMTGEYFTQTSEGKDLGKDFLALLVYFSLIFIITFYQLYNLSTITYYSLIAIFGNILLMVSISAIAQTGIEIPGLDISDWVGFYGEVFSSANCILIMLTIILAACTPSWLCLSFWTHFNATDQLLVIEKETIAAHEDQPLFFSRKKAEV